MAPRRSPRPEHGESAMHGPPWHPDPQRPLETAVADALITTPSPTSDPQRLHA